MKDWWLDDIERIEEDFCFERITVEEGIGQLKRLGFDPDEAETLLKESIA